MKKIFFVFFLAALFLVGFRASGQSIFDITFPVPELGNCADQASCKAYCDDLSHKDACVEFGKKHGLISEEAAQKAKELPRTGPGGCQSEETCRSYCQDAAHLDECLNFAEAHGLLKTEEIKKAKEFLGQTGPGGCKGANECRSYCEDAAHKQECIEFAHRKGLISDRDAEVAQKVATEGGPGGCRGEQECKAYCSDAAHLDECLKFGEDHGFISAPDAARIRKSGFGGAGPGGCKGNDECRTYCEDASHQEECIRFAEEKGFMSHDEAERARKFAGKTGPGGCTGEQCKEFCSNAANAETCLQYAEKEGLIPPEEAARASKFLKVSQEGGPGGCRGEQCKDYCQDPAHQDECFTFAKDKGLIRAEDEQNFEAGKKIRQVVEQNGGPGGCKNDDQCRSYCSDAAHVEECVAFGAAHGGIPEEQVRQMLKEFQENRFQQQGEFHSPEEFNKLEAGAQERVEEFKQLEENFRGGPQGPGFNGFPAGPQGFPGGQGPQGEFREGLPGGVPNPTSAVVGPGGCSSPTECIKYCTEHKEECFHTPPQPSGESGQGNFSPRGSAAFPTGAVPQLRSNLIREFKSNELPPGFQERSPEAREEFFRKQFEQSQEGLGGQFPNRPGEFPGRGPEGGRPNEFPGRGPQEFPGKPGEFPGKGPGEFQGQYPFPGKSPEGFRGEPDQFPGRGPENSQSGFPSGQPPGSFQNPSNFPAEGSTSQPPPPGGTSYPTPSGGTFTPPPGTSYPSSPPPSSFPSAPPPSSNYAPPPSSPPPSQPPPPPSSQAPFLNRLFGKIIDILR